LRRKAPTVDFDSYFRHQIFVQGRLQDSMSRKKPAEKRVFLCLRRAVRRLGRQPRVRLEISQPYR
jgi:hypothetical protein